MKIVGDTVNKQELPELPQEQGLIEITPISGDICAVIDLEKFEIGDTICDFENPEPLPPIAVDEPTGNLDSKASREIMDLLRLSNEKYGQTIIMITKSSRDNSKVPFSFPKVSFWHFEISYVAL